MIFLDNVSKYYPHEKVPALDEVTLHIAPKEFVFIVGASGAGKSTLIKMLTREEKPSYGKIIVGGIDYDYMKKRHIPHIRRRLGVVFQDFKLFPNRTVYENVAFTLEIVGVPTAEIKRTVPKVLELVGLSGKENKFPHELSGGQRQRVAIARAMARQPKILIADEPTGNLDPENSIEIMRLLEEINNFGTTIIVTTHDEKVVNLLKKRVVTIRDGKVIGDQVRGGHYDLDASRTKIEKRSLGAQAPKEVPAAPVAQAAPAPAPAAPAAPIKHAAPVAAQVAAMKAAKTVKAPAAQPTVAKPALKPAKPSASGSAVLEQMRRAKAADEAKPVAKRRKFIH